MNYKSGGPGSIRSGRWPKSHICVFWAIIVQIAYIFTCIYSSNQTYQCKQTEKYQIYFLLEGVACLFYLKKIANLMLFSKLVTIKGCLIGESAQTLKSSLPISILCTISLKSEVLPVSFQGIYTRKDITYVNVTNLVNTRMQNHK